MSDIGLVRFSSNGAESLPAILRHLPSLINRDFPVVARTRCSAPISDVPAWELLCRGFVDAGFGCCNTKAVSNFRLQRGRPCRIVMPLLKDNNWTWWASGERAKGKKRLDRLGKGIEREAKVAPEGGATKDRWYLKLNCCTRPTCSDKSSCPALPVGRGP